MIRSMTPILVLILTFHCLALCAEETGQAIEWRDWRGVDRQGHYPALPKRLPDDPQVYWRAPVTGPAMAGIAATRKYVVVPDKDRGLSQDIFRCFDADTGDPLWTLEYEAKQKLDYTNAPRATPVIHGNRVYLQGALGQLHCVELNTGEIVWQRHLINDFGGKLVTWGYSISPLVVGNKLIVMPGGEACSVCALDLNTGEALWEILGKATAYSCLIQGNFGGMDQVVGYDEAGLCGWDPNLGIELWRMTPPGAPDFNVPTPVVVDNGDLILSTENHGTRRYAFDPLGILTPEPIAVNQSMAPDTTTPVAWKNRLFGAAYGELFCLDLANNLQTVWDVQDDIYYDHTNLVAGNDRVLAWTTSSDLILFRADADKYEVVSRLRPFDRERSESMSHPAFVGKRIYLRDQEEIVCLQLSE